MPKLAPLVGVAALALLALAPGAQAYNLVTVCDLPVSCPPIWIEVGRADDGAMFVRMCWDLEHDPDWKVGPEHNPGGGVSVYVPEGADRSQDGSHRADYSGECTASEEQGPLVSEA